MKNGYDHRNLGGKEAIVKQFTAHKLSLMNIKPVIKISSPVYKKFDKSKNIITQQKFFLHNDYHLVRSTLNTVGKMKNGIVNSKCP